mgnify:CR=1 FL=1
MLPGWLYEYSSTFKGRLKMQLGLCPMSVVCVHSNVQTMGNLCHSIFVQQGITPVLDPICPFTGTALLSQLRVLFLLLALFQLEAPEFVGFNIPHIYGVVLKGTVLPLTAGGLILKAVDANVLTLQESLLPGQE